MKFISLIGLVCVLGCVGETESVPDEPQKCEVIVEVPETPDPDAENNGYCDADHDCAASDYCLVEWCHGTWDDCEQVNRCTPKQAEGEWCEGDNWCAFGLECPIPDGLKASTCSPINV